MNTQFTIGSDPEYFLQNSQGKLISAIGLIEGSKDAPFAVKNGHVHPDNVCIEMNTNPSATKDQFRIVTRALLDEVRDIAMDNGLMISGKSYGEFEDDQLCHPDALESGCEPDFNAYNNGHANTPPNYSLTKARAAGGHIHIGCAINDLPAQLLHKLVKTLDLTVTLPMVCREDEKRRELYGKAGAFRVKPYGLEYRTPSNAWTLSDKRVEWVYDAVERALNAFATIPLDPKIPDLINRHDVNGAYRMVQSYGLECMPY